MSMDYWLQAFDKGEEGFFPLSIVEEAFGDALTEKKYLIVKPPENTRFIQS